MAENENSDTPPENAQAGEGGAGEGSKKKKKLRSLKDHWALLAGAAVAGLVELLSLPPDDNFTIPLASGAAMHFIPLVSGA